MSAERCQRDFVPYVIENSSRVASHAWKLLVICAANMAIFLRIELDSATAWDIIIMTLMPRRRPAPDDSKAAALRAAGALHPHPERITDELFAQSPFFDRRDRVQVKYEMLRAHDVDGRQISKVARAFGTSRQAIYAAATAFRAQGIPGLLPRPRGPKRAHKCTDEILDLRRSGELRNPRTRRASPTQFVIGSGSASTRARCSEPWRGEQKKAARRERGGHEHSCRRRSDMRTLRGAAPGGAGGAPGWCPQSRLGALSSARDERMVCSAHRAGAGTARLAPTGGTS